MKNRKQGFTLMEVALAVVVVGVGVLAMFALISSGLDSSAKAVATTQAAFFADATFTAIRAEASRASESKDQMAWTNFWTAVKNGSTNFSVAMRPAWYGYTGTERLAANELKIQPNQANAIRISFDNRLMRSGIAAIVDGTIPSGAIRYRLLTSNVTVNATGTTGSRDPKSVTLLIWPGPGPTSGPMVAPSNAIAFYTEVANTGSL
jgi:type IV pilus modification protein PilV